MPEHFDSRERPVISWEEARWLIRDWACFDGVHLLDHECDLLLRRILDVTIDGSGQVGSKPAQLRKEMRDGDKPKP